MQQRLQAFLAHSGVASRRKAEVFIAAGRVTVNGKRVQEPGTKVDPARDLVTVDGKLIEQRQEEKTYLLYKPPGCVTTLSDPEGRPTVASYLEGIEERVFPVGRLDYDAEGAVLFTTDGELANRLAHPRYGHRRTYLVKVKGRPTEATLMRMVEGVTLDDGPAQALDCSVHEHTEKNVWIRLTVGEGRNHLVKRLCAAVGLTVQRLFRPEFGGVSVERLRPGRYRLLLPEEVKELKRRVGLVPGDKTEIIGGARPLPKAARRNGHGPPPARRPRDPG